MIQFQENAQTDRMVRRKDGRVDRPYFIGHFQLMPGDQKIPRKVHTRFKENIWAADLAKME